MRDMADFTFPDDLVQTARTFAEAGAGLRALYASLPSDAQQWTVEQRQQVAAARTREREAALTLARHEHWQTLAGGDRTAAKAALQQQTAAELADR